MRLTIAFAVTLTLMLTFASSEATAHHGPENITIDAAAAKQPPVPFTHGKHATKLVKSCDTCHHTQKGLTAESKVKVEKCSSCHLDGKGGAPSMREMSLQKNPFHNPLCIDCHKKEKGPTACAGCHVKK